jgi:hemerythrin-like metal-binding protein
MILVHTLNEASVKLAGDPGIALLERIVQDLLSYALYHFETEEGLMQEYGYSENSGDDAARHLEQHRAFSSKVVEVHESLKQGTPVAPADLLGFLNDWLVNHILNTDKKLGAYIAARRAASSSSS